MISPRCDTLKNRARLKTSFPLRGLKFGLFSGEDPLPRFSFQLNHRGSPGFKAFPSALSYLFYVSLLGKEVISSYEYHHKYDGYHDGFDPKIVHRAQTQIDINTIGHVVAEGKLDL